jgi:hypothetical protein
MKAICNKLSYCDIIRRHFSGELLTISGTAVYRMDDSGTQHLNLSYVQVGRPYL